LLYVNRFSPENSKMLNALEGFVREYNPSWIGISLTASEFPSARDITVYLKQKFDSLPVVWGGIQPTADTNRCAKYADYVCIGEQNHLL
jgi:radical SAM superfamily enzyme YgiQ (UPF0313 family)